MDVLAAVMSELDFRAAGYRCFELSAPWAISFDQSGLRGIHVLVEGRCEIALPGQPPEQLQTGDLIIAPRADPHILRSVGTPRVQPRPSVELAGSSPREDTARTGAGERTVLLCGAFVFNAADHATLAALPRFVRISGADRDAARWLGSYVDTITTEAREAGPGSEVVLARLTEALVIRALRHALGHIEETGWLKGLGDAGVARALSAIHDDYRRKWTVASLAREAGQSRAVFAGRFQALVGEPPMQYLFRRRMREAARLLKRGGISLSEVAEEVGYGSEAAVSAAFKRYSNLSPGAYRRTANKETG